MKTLNIIKSLRMWSTDNYFNLCRIHLYFFVGNNKIQENKVDREEFTPLQISIKLLTP